MEGHSVTWGFCKRSLTQVSSSSFLSTSASHRHRRLSTQVFARPPSFPHPPHIDTGCPHRCSPVLGAAALPGNGGSVYNPSRAALSSSEPFQPNGHPRNDRFLCTRVVFPSESFIVVLFIVYITWTGCKRVTGYFPLYGFSSEPSARSCSFLALSSHI